MQLNLKTETDVGSLHVIDSDRPIASTLAERYSTLQHVAWTCFVHFYAVFNHILQSTGSSCSDVISGVVIDDVCVDIRVKYNNSK